MNILIADDEELVRVGLSDIILKIHPDAVISEAINGRTLIEAVKNNPPDLCFTDIKMPGISGLDAIEQLIDEYPDICWIILSGYSDFEYARKAITLGALDYLLKPATADELAVALGKVIKKLLLINRQKREKFEYRVGGVLSNSSAVEFDDYIAEHHRWSVMVFIPGPQDGSISVDQQRRLFSHLRLMIDNISFSGSAGLFNILEGLPAVISGSETPLEILEKLKRELPDDLYSDCRILISPVQDNLTELLSFCEKDSEMNSIQTIVNDLSDKSSRIVLQAEKLVKEQYNSPIGVAQIAEQLNLTPNYLSSVFKKYKNVSFTKYITDIRLNEAPGLLETPGITVKEAASRLGYMSSRHFARLFREKYGMSPSDYRK